jgi:Fe-S-cluster containining protein
LKASFLLILSCQFRKHPLWPGIGILFIFPEFTRKYAMFPLQLLYGKCGGKTTSRKVPVFLSRMMQTSNHSFYHEGLCFSCTRCSACCRHDPGYVFLSGNDVRLLAEGLQMEYTEVMEKYCRWVPSSGEEKQLSLKEKTGFDCIFWQDGCKVYKYRPLQCRTFPFWQSTLSTRQAWESLSCPGIGNGMLRSREYIETCLERRRREPVLTRGA